MIEGSTEYKYLRIDFKLSLNSKFKKIYLKLRLKFISTI